MEYFVQLYESTKYRSLDLLQRPFIFAYSALIDAEVEQKCQEIGFDSCFSAPMNFEAFRNQVLPFLEESVNNYLLGHMSQD